MSVFDPPPKPKTPLGYHRILSPNASVKVSPICLGGISIGNSWSELFGKNEDPFKLMDAYFALGGNFIDTSNTYNSEDSERLIGEWMEARGNRDQMVIATKYSAGYKAYDKANLPLQSNYTGNSAKSMHISVKDSLKKLRTDYIDILYVHWWDFGTSVEEIMTHLHAYVMARQVLYLGISDAPAWVVVKANEFARRNGMTPFSVYQGRWNAAFRDMEAEIIPMCEDQGMAVVPWSALGGGQLATTEQRKQLAEGPNARSFNAASDNDIKVSEACESIASARNTTLQVVVSAAQKLTVCLEVFIEPTLKSLFQALAYLFAQTPYVFPIVGVNTLEHIEAMPAALKVKLNKEEVEAIQSAIPFHPLFPVSFLLEFRGDQKYNLSLTAGHNQQYQMAAWIDAPPKPPVSDTK